jgi:multidrug efflux system membrane fusion protein
VEEDSSGSYVLVVDESNVAHRRDVTTGRSDPSYIAITQGLQAGETVVTISAFPAKEGQTVKLTSPGPAPAGGAAPAAGGGYGAAPPPAAGGRR